MEIVLILVLLICILAIMFGKTRPGGDEFQPSKPNFGRKTKSRFQPFDAHNANPLPASSVLQGAAYVIDGDTLVIQKTQIRLFGVDAPELNHPYGNKAKWALFALCKKQTVRAELSEQDVHGRTVARCYLQDGRDLSEEMVKMGLAIDWPKYSGGQYGPFEIQGVRKKLWLADARQKGRIHVWEKFEAAQGARKNNK